MSMVSECLSCGACCAKYRVSFYWGELCSGGGSVPDEWVEPVNGLRACMSGTNRANPRCDALQGQVGVQVSCAIYDSRPSPCREFDIYNSDGTTNIDCDRARADYGMEPVRIIVLPCANDEELINQSAS